MGKFKYQTIWGGIFTLIVGAILLGYAVILSMKVWFSAVVSVSQETQHYQTDGFVFDPAPDGFKLLVGLLEN